MSVGKKGKVNIAKSIAYSREVLLLSKRLPMILPLLLTETKYLPVIASIAPLADRDDPTHMLPWVPLCRWCLLPSLSYLRALLLTHSPFYLYGLCAMTTWWSDQRSTWSRPTMASAVPALAGEMLLEMMLQGVMRWSSCGIRRFLKEMRWGKLNEWEIPNNWNTKLKIPKTI